MWIFQPIQERLREEQAEIEDFDQECQEQEEDDAEVQAEIDQVETRILKPKF